MLGEDLAEARIRQQRLALLGGLALVNKVDVELDHVSYLSRITGMDDTGNLHCGLYLTFRGTRRRRAADLARGTPSY
ncbi:hypothetical protein GCM10027589_43650 [Actinocorallia lasiicapitis]